jgi:hypothetical protein
MARITDGSSMLMLTRMAPLHFGQTRGSTFPAFETVSQLFSLLVPKKMAYSQLFLNLRGKTPPKNRCFHPVFELRHSLLRRDRLLFSE